MRILAVANTVPMRDRSAGAYRFSSLLELLARHHEVHLHARTLDWQRRHFGPSEVEIYVQQLALGGVRVTDGSAGALAKLLHSGDIDVAFLEHYQTARQGVVDLIRLHRPEAHIVVDTVDVAFNRLEAKARLTGLPEDRYQAEKVKHDELAAYARADLVIAISPTDAAILEAANARLRVEVVPLIYRMHELPAGPPRPQRRELMFVADFRHDANVDGIRHFCAEVLPLVVCEIPDVHLRVVGASPPEEVRALAGPNVEVLGFVPDLDAIYRTSDVAIAPMRFGGGLKGKIAEAMAHGLPVVTNSVSLTGFEAKPGSDVMVGDDAQTFARCIVALLQDDELHAQVRHNGWNFVNTNYSRDGVAKMLDDLMARIPALPVQRLPLTKRAAHAAQSVVERHVAWRFR